MVDQIAEQNNSQITGNENVTVSESSEKPQQNFRNRLGDRLQQMVNGIRQLIPKRPERALSEISNMNSLSVENEEKDENKREYESKDLPPNFNVRGEQEKQLAGLLYGIMPEKIKKSFEKTISSLTYPSDRKSAGDGMVYPAIDNEGKKIDGKVDVQIGQCLDTRYGASLMLHEMGHVLKTSLQDDEFADERRLYEQAESEMEDYKPMRESHNAVNALQLWILYPKVLDHISDHPGWSKLQKVMRDLIPLTDVERKKIEDALAKMENDDKANMERKITEEIEKQKGLPEGLRWTDETINAKYTRIYENQRTPPIKNILRQDVPEEKWKN